MKSERSLYPFAERLGKAERLAHLLTVEKALRSEKSRLTKKLLETPRSVDSSTHDSLSTKVDVVLGLLLDVGQEIEGLESAK